jgi:hypothetical protein
MIILCKFHEEFCAENTGVARYFSRKGLTRFPQAICSMPKVQLFTFIPSQPTVRATLRQHSPRRSKESSEKVLIATRTAKTAKPRGCKQIECTPDEHSWEKYDVTREEASFDSRDEYQEWNECKELKAYQYGNQITALPIRLPLTMVDG